MQKLKIVVLEKNDDNQNGVSNYLKKKGNIKSKKILILLGLIKKKFKKK